MSLSSHARTLADQLEEYFRGLAAAVMEEEGVPDDAVFEARMGPRRTLDESEAVVETRLTRRIWQGQDDGPRLLVGFETRLELLKGQKRRPGGAAAETLEASAQPWRRECPTPRSTDDPR